MRMTTIYTTMAALLFFAASETAYAQSVEGASPLSAFKNGETVTVHGKVGQASHDMALVVPGCSEAAVLVYAGDPESRESGENLLKDESLWRFENYLWEDW
jgi:hypothetical protein